jgi:hypothetical protein
MPNDGVNPTARWLARGIWKFLFVLVVTLLIFGLVGFAVRAAFGATGDGPAISSHETKGAPPAAPLLAARMEPSVQRSVAG